MMNNTEESPWTIPPIPWDPEDVWLGSCPTVTNYLFDAFRIAFGIRPIDAEYDRFPDGFSVRLIIDKRLSIKHHIWSSDMYTKLRRSGLDLSVTVYSTISPVRIEDENGETEALFRAFHESRKRRQEQIAVA